MKNSQPNIMVIGSCNMDLVVRSPRIPVVGETVLGDDFNITPGGKGANQAVAAAKLGANVNFLTRLGNDMFATQAQQNLTDCGIKQDFVLQTPDTSTGVALINLDSQGNNCITVAPGANALLTPQDVQASEQAIANSAILVLQLETPLETVTAAAKLAHSHNVPVILNPAPAQKLPADLLQYVTILTPNETEASLISGIEVTDQNSAKQAAVELMKLGVQQVIITLGKQGVLAVTADDTFHLPACKVVAVDTVAAGDAFNGALAVALAKGNSLKDAARFANCVAALAVTKKGAQAAMPLAAEVETFIQRQP